MMTPRRSLEVLFLTVLGTFGGCSAGCSCPPPQWSRSVHPVAPAGAAKADVALDCARICGPGATCVETQLPDGTPALECAGDPPPPCYSGRRPRGLVGSRTTRRAAAPRAGAMLAQMAELEAASAFAFEGLARELAAFGAPTDLVTRCRVAAAEEARHARVVRAHARRRGGRPRAVRVTAAAPRSLADLAIENAREGCVLETFAALHAAHHAVAATDPPFGAAMRAIPRDEASHAAIARDIDAWATARLDAEERARVEAAHVEAWASLVVATDGGAEPALGMPCGRARAALAAALREALAAA
ncbi:MAG: hypothetical protein U0414_12190 [Polyangiaceae bacterium]